MTPSNEDLEREFERLLRNPVTRRRILQRGAAGALSVSALAYLAACGTDEMILWNGIIMTLMFQKISPLPRSRPVPTRKPKSVGSTS